MGACAQSHAHLPIDNLLYSSKKKSIIIIIMAKCWLLNQVQVDECKPCINPSTDSSLK